jgi:hypothetical protein
LTDRAEALEAKQKIEDAQKNARDGVDASMEKSKVHSFEQEWMAPLESDVDTGMTLVTGYKVSWLTDSFRHADNCPLGFQDCSERPG